MTNLVERIATIVRKANCLQPELGLGTVATNVNVRRLVVLQAVEEERVRTDAKHNGHGFSVSRRSSIDSQGRRLIPNDKLINEVNRRAREETSRRQYLGTWLLYAYRIQQRTWAEQLNYLRGHCCSQACDSAKFTVTDVQGKPFTLSALKGRVVLLDFWAIACGGCKVELPWYVGFDQQYRTKGLSLVGLDMYGEKPEAVKSFASAHNMRYPVAIGTDEIGALYKLGEMPLTILIDRRGRIAVSHVGVVDPKVFESNIKILLAE